MPHMEIHDQDLLSAREFVDLAKEACQITKPNTEMTDDEIRTVTRWIGQQASDSLLVDGRLIIGRIGLGIMLFVSMLEFPEFFDRHGLSQEN